MSAAPGLVEPRSIVEAAPVRIGVVSFLNTLPLIDGLDRLAGFDLRHSVPSRLVDQLVAADVDLALCSSIDYQRSPLPLVIAPIGLLGSDGPTLTVRLYSAGPVETIRQVHCDTDSHTSIALLRIVLREMHGLEPALFDYDAGGETAGGDAGRWPEAILLIGDKVVTDSPALEQYPHQLDLGAAWRELTGLPFVFALWMARADADRDLIIAAARILDRQRRHNRERIDRIIHSCAGVRRWPQELARSYLQRHLTYEFDGRALAGLEAFFERAQRHGVIGQRRPIELLDV